MLVRRGDRERVARVDALQQLQALDRAGRPIVDQAQLFQVPVEQRMQAAVRRFLPDEGLDFGAKALLLFRRQGLEPVAHRIDEELLAHREAHGQSVEERRAKSVAAAPMARDRCFHVDKQAADNEVCHFPKTPDVAEIGTRYIMGSNHGTVKYRKKIG